MPTSSEGVLETLREYYRNKDAVGMRKAYYISAFLLSDEERHKVSKALATLEGNKTVTEVIEQTKGCFW